MATISLTLFSDTIGLIQQTLATLPVDSVAQLWDAHSATLVHRLGRQPDGFTRASTRAGFQILQAMWFAPDTTGWYASAGFQLFGASGTQRRTATLILGSCRAPIAPRPGLCAPRPGP